MVRRLLPVLMLVGTLVPAKAAEPDRLTVRGDAWQNVLDRGSFRFSESDASVLFALSQFGGKCQIHMIYDPAKWWSITFKFVKDGKELLTIDGHTKSVFCADKNILYFAHFSTSSQGCVVTAHDLETGKKLWETELNALPLATHSSYSNEVTMGLSNLTGTEMEGEGIVSVTGHESYGDYIEILDRETGKILAHKVYRQR